MAYQDTRQAIVRENIPKLIKSLTNLKDDDSNYKLCEQFAFQFIKNYRNISINSHEIRRKIEGILERFNFENHSEYADVLKKMYELLISHPQCIDHYETDIQWSVLDFLLSIAKNPFMALRKTPSILDDIEITSEKPIGDSLHYWTKLLIEENFHKPLSEDSDLSDWSDSNESNEILSPNSKDINFMNAKLMSEDIYSQIPFPKPPQVFEKYNSKDSAEWVLKNIQKSHLNDENCKTSQHQGSNFCMLWNKYSSLVENCDEKEIKIASEYYLLREIIWMLHEPVTCKFFSVRNGTIAVIENVSLSSTTPEILSSYLQTIIPYMLKINVLRQFIENVYIVKNHVTVAHTYECYANGLKQLLAPFYTALLKEEEEIKSQCDNKIYTLIQFRKNLNESFDYLDQLYSIHDAVVLDSNKFPAHICAAHLLAGLLQKVRFSFSTQISNLAMVLYISSIKSFFSIIDVWWMEGRLDDWRNEFLIEKSVNVLDNKELHSMRRRSFDNDENKGFLLRNNILKTIHDDLLLDLIMKHSLESATILNLLHEINSISNIKHVIEQQDTLYDNFLKELLFGISQFSNKVDDIIELSKSSENIHNSETEDKITSPESSIFGDIYKDPFLEAVFDYNSSNHIVKYKNPVNILEIYERLNKTSNLTLPLEEIAYNTLYKLLSSRTISANSFLIKMYIEKFEILKQLENLRKVMFLEASVVMSSFYVQLFTQIETTNEWANSFLLTYQLDDLLCSKFPELASEFRVEIEADCMFNSLKVIAALDKINIKYVLKHELKTIISDNNLEDYNKVFQFVMKLKWGLWSLENLLFSKQHCKRPYSELKIMDFFMRRLEQIRFWLLNAVQCVHFYVIINVFQSMTQQFNNKISHAENLEEIKSLHNSYINTICEQCFLRSNHNDIKVGVEQLLELIFVLKNEWHSCIKEIQGCIDSNNDSSMNSESSYTYSSVIDDIERTYIRCHQYLANIFNNEVYSEKKAYLASLTQAFNSSLPY